MRKEFLLPGLGVVYRTAVVPHVEVSAAFVVDDDNDEEGDDVTDTDVFSAETCKPVSADVVSGCCCAVVSGTPY